MLIIRSETTLGYVHFSVSNLQKAWNPRHDRWGTCPEWRNSYAVILHTVCAANLTPRYKKTDFFADNEKFFDSLKICSPHLSSLPSPSYSLSTETSLLARLKLLILQANTTKTSLCCRKNRINSALLLGIPADLSESLQEQIVYHFHQSTWLWKTLR